MKKIIIFILMFFTIPTISVFAVMETITYDVTVYEDKGYNLITGQFEDMSSFASTNRLLVNSVEIDFVVDTFHHVLYWDNNNKYIGYSNSQYSNLELSTYIPAAINNYITMPPNTKFIAFMVSSGVDASITALGGDSLSDMFDTLNLTALENLVTNGGFSDGTAWWTANLSSHNVTDNVLENIGAGTFVSPSSLRNIGTYTTDILYVHLEAKTINTAEYVGVNFRGTTTLGTVKTIYQLQPVNNQWYIIKQGFQMVGGAGNLELRLEHNYPSNALANGSKAYFKNVHLFNLTASYGVTSTSGTAYDNAVANIEREITRNGGYIEETYTPNINAIQANYTLTYNQIIEYWELYNEILLNYPFALSATSLMLMQPITYQRDEVTPLPVEGIDTKIENYLTDLNVNTPFAKTLLAISMIIIVMVALALIKTPKYIFIGAGIMIYIFFTLLGWFPIWILVLLGILVIGMLIMSFRGSGGGSDD